MGLAEELKERGFVYQFSGDSLEAVLNGKEKRTVYLGIDPTADSMHVGHLVPYMMLNHIMRAGHEVIALMGGGTALIGDPSFKETERDIASEEEIAEQCRNLEENVRKITTSDSIRFVNNHDWLSQLPAITFLRDVGKHFTVNAMIKKESVARRFQEEEGISFTEFSYSLLQAYDFHHLFREANCTLQIGGSDQWGNIIAGVDYIRRVSGAEVYGLTMPLVVDKATGKKFGKSEGNAVWLDPKKTSPYQFYQFWLNTSDESVIDYLKLFTFITLDEIRNIESEAEADPGKRSAQRRLADEVTAFIHGESVRDAVRKVSGILFDNGADTLSPEEEEILYQNAPTHPLEGEMSLVDVLVLSTLATSKREARTFIESKAIELDGKTIEDVAYSIDPSSVGKNFSVLKRGKRNLCVLRYR